MMKKVLFLAVCFVPVLAFAKTPGDFNLANKFSVEIDGVVISNIRNVVGLEPIVRSAGSKSEDFSTSTLQKVPGKHKPPTITLKRGKSQSMELFSWRESVIKGAIEKKTVSVIFHNASGTESGRINFYGCFPVKWTGPSFNAQNSGHVVESLTFTYERAEIKGSLPTNNKTPKSNLPGVRAGSALKPGLGGTATQPLTPQRTGNREFFNVSSSDSFTFPSSTPPTTRTSTPLGQ